VLVTALPPRHTSDPSSTLPQFKMNLNQEGGQRRSVWPLSRLAPWLSSSISLFIMTTDPWTNGTSRSTFRQSSPSCPKFQELIIAVAIVGACFGQFKSLLITILALGYGTCIQQLIDLRPEPVFGDNLTTLLPCWAIVTFMMAVAFLLDQ
jgi:hypothetical protein